MARKKKAIDERKIVVSVTMDRTLTHRVARLNISNFSKFVSEAVEEKIDRMEHKK